MSRLQSKSLTLKMVKLLLVVSLLLIHSFPSAASTVLIVRSEGIRFEKTVTGILEELDGELDHYNIALAKGATKDDLNALLVQYKPNALVMMGNQQLNLFKA